MLPHQQSRVKSYNDLDRALFSAPASKAHQLLVLDQDLAPTKHGKSLFHFPITAAQTMEHCCGYEAMQ